MDGSSDYYESENFKRMNHETLDEEEDSSHKTLNYDYIKELIHERNKLDNDSHAARLLDQGILSHNSFQLHNFHSLFLKQKFTMQKQMENLFETTDMSMFTGKNQSKL
jgi:hypothetical protein